MNDLVAPLSIFMKFIFSTPFFVFILRSFQLSAWLQCRDIFRWRVSPAFIFAPPKASSKIVSSPMQDALSWILFLLAFSRLFLLCKSPQGARLEYIIMNHTKKSHATSETVNKIPPLLLAANPTVLRY